MALAIVVRALPDIVERFPCTWAGVSPLLNLSFSG
jgi:hypothetical protein